MSVIQTEEVAKVEPHAQPTPAVATATATASASISITFTPRMIERLTHQAFDTYVEAVGGKAHDGSPIRPWSLVTGTKQGEAWRAAVCKILTLKANL